MVLEKNKKYKGLLTLKGLEAIAPNSVVADRFKELGFVNVISEGNGLQRNVSGTWGGDTMEIEIPDRIKNLEAL